MPRPEWIGKHPGNSPDEPVFVAELAGESIHWLRAGDYDYRISPIDVRQPVDDFKKFGPPDREIPDELGREVAGHLGIAGHDEPHWLRPRDPRVVDLAMAAGKGDWATVDSLRDCINAYSPTRETALTLSLDKPLAVLEGLLARGADPGIRIRFGWTPLAIACSKGLEGHVRALLAAGADATVRDETGSTALAVAGYSGQRACAEALLEHYSRQGMRVESREVVAALIGGLSALAEEMARRWPVDASGEMLFAAIRGGSLTLFRRMLDLHVDPNVREVGSFEITPLMAAVQIPDREEVASELLRRGADVHAKDTRGEIALVWACNPGYRKMLLDAGADPDSRCHEGCTLLLKLCEAKAPIQDVRMLLDAGANCNATQPGNNTPLQRAAGNGDLALVKLLLERGADLSAVDECGHTARWWARTEEIARLLGA